MKRQWLQKCKNGYDIAHVFFVIQLFSFLCECVQAGTGTVYASPHYNLKFTCHLDVKRTTLIAELCTTIPRGLDTLFQ